jgi:GDP-mannose 6-dehydrogenase
LHDLELPILNAILPSNQLQLARGLRLITEKGRKRIGILGFSFKEGTDDLRESPMIEIIEQLVGKGYDVRIYDKNVQVARLVGANRDFILNRIPHISRLMVDNIDAILQHAETIVIGNKSAEFEGVLQGLHSGQCLVDFMRISNCRINDGEYSGICW